MNEPIRKTEAAKLKVFQYTDKLFWVESSKGKIAYRVSFENAGHSCTCGDFTSNSVKSENYLCKHVLAVIDANGDFPKLDLISKTRPKLDERFLTNIQGKDFVLYAGLLDLAHQRGIRKIQVEAVQYPTKENGYEAICKATVESVTGDLYVEWGDANPKNVNRKISSHILRMAATRAKARALRDFTNIGITCLEELGDLDEETPEKEPRRRKANNVVPIKDSGKSRGSKTTETNEDQNELFGADEPKAQANPAPSPAQRKAMENLAKRRGISNEQLEDMAQQHFGTGYLNINSNEAANFIRILQQSS